MGVHGVADPLAAARVRDEEPGRLSVTSPLPYILLSYLLGSIPTSFWVGKAVYGIDLRKEGSGNLGATNAFRVMGWKAALPVMVVDVAKGFVPAWLFPQLDAVG